MISSVKPTNLGAGFGLELKVSGGLSEPLTKSFSAPPIPIPNAAFSMCRLVPLPYYLS
jgi:hypothetical protein